MRVKTLKKCDLERYGVREPNDILEVDHCTFVAHQLMGNVAPYSEDAHQLAQALPKPAAATAPRPQAVYSPEAMSEALGKYYDVDARKPLAEAAADLKELAAGQRRQTELLERLVAAVEAGLPLNP